MAKAKKKHAGGRPRAYKTVAAMQEAIDAYFDKVESDDDILTITGLALALGFCTRHALLTYEGYSKEFYHVIKTAKLKVEHSYEKRLSQHACTGSIFALKNFNWQDRRDVNMAGNLTIAVIDYANVDDTKPT